jgi:hypothetical protein
MIAGPHITTSGMSILDLNQLMADRVTIWADKKLRARLAREATTERVTGHERQVARVAAAKLRTTEGVRSPWTARHRVG